MKVILSIDQSTTASKAILIDEKLNVIASHSELFEQHYPEPGWVEHDLDEIWKTVCTSIETVLKKTPSAEVIAIGITNQRETICFWNKHTALPLSRAIVWQDRRTAEMCAKLKKKGLEKKFQKKTGLLLDPYFSGTKVVWALKNWKAVRDAAKRNELAVGTIDSYLIARLTNGKSHVTEPSNASRTLCFNIQSLKFDAELCKLLGLPLSIWPTVQPSSSQFGHTKNVRGLKDGIPITGVLGDQQAALMGQGCFEPCSAKCTYGTGAFLLMNIGKKPVFSKNRLLTTVAWQLSAREVVYAFEGSAFIAGAAVQWLRDGLGLIKNSKDIEPLAASVDSTDGVVFVPALTGMGAPYWNPQATGLFTGLRRSTKPSHLARAVLEGIAFQNVDLVRAMEKDLGKKIKSLSVDGGASANSLLMQLQSDFLGVPLKRPMNLDTTLLGATFVAGLGAGVWKDLGQLKAVWKLEREFEPKLSKKERDSESERWKLAVKKVLVE